MKLMLGMSKMRSTIFGVSNIQFSQERQWRRGGGGGDDDNGELKWKLLCSRAKVGVGGDTPDTFFRVNSFSGMEILMPFLGAMKILKFP